MSRRHHHNAKLKGYIGPFYPPELEFLFDADRSPVTISECDQMGQSQALAEYFGSPAVHTTDGYVWFTGIMFGFPIDNGFPRRVVLALPWAQDWEAEAGTKMDRSPALYIEDMEGPDLMKKVAELLNKLSLWQRSPVSPEGDRK